MPQKWFSFLKKIHCIFRYIRGGRGGVRQDVTNVTLFFLFFFEGFPNAVVPEDISSSSESVRVLPRQRHPSKLGELHGSPNSPRPTLVLKLK